MWHSAVAGPLSLTYERLGVAGDDEHVLVVYQPEPGTPTAQRLGLLAAPAV
ncbi:hypothetical protein VA596_26765 [Amycolatopsis sp., V23-08]|uniref:MmyB-like transcription regulator ligand binding domain-containing protein n=1 Tax=Amycolatopsis heterodermiae TaxID=3110235 RepID=A0ABU5RAA9_9PSEU|nr:hypothetical protein [Amycolatopsis sp., V23-08]MEA5363161.1 hypothetical protein [Amycolatopsis sp., V23-08]